MKLDRMHYLLRLMPRNASYITIVAGGDPRFDDNPDVNLWAKVRNDPSFCYSFVSSFLEARQPMPSDVEETDLQRLYAFKRYRRWDDRPALDACTLTHPAMIVWRTIIQCFLMHPGVHFEWIAEATGFSLEVIRLYHSWFFHARDRSAVFLLNLVYPESRQVEFTYNYHLSENWTQIAKRIAYNKGILPMLRWLGGRPSDTEVAGLESMRALESGITSGGRFAIECGFGHQPNVVSISGARQLLQSSKLGGQEAQDDDMVMGFGRISADQGAQLVIKQMTQSAAMEKLRKATLYDTSIAEQLKLETEEKERKNLPPL